MRIVAHPVGVFERPYRSPDLKGYERKIIALLADFLDGGLPVTALCWTHNATVYVLRHLPNDGPHVDGSQIEALLPRAQAKHRSIFRRMTRIFKA